MEQIDGVYNDLNTNLVFYRQLEEKIQLTPLTILTGKNCVLLNLVQEWLLGCF